MTLEIIFIACLLKQPSSCVTTKGPFEGQLPFKCYVAAQQQIADFMKDKPGWFIQRYGCQHVGTHNS